MPRVLASKATGRVTCPILLYPVAHPLLRLLAMLARVHWSQGSLPLMSHVNATWNPCQILYPLERTGR